MSGPASKKRKAAGGAAKATASAPGVAIGSALLLADLLTCDEKELAKDICIAGIDTQKKAIAKLEALLTAINAYRRNVAPTWSRPSPAPSFSVASRHSHNPNIIYLTTFH